MSHEIVFIGPPIYRRYYDYEAKKHVEYMQLGNTMEDSSFIADAHMPKWMRWGIEK